MQAPKLIHEKPFAFATALAAAFTGVWAWVLVRFWMDFYTPIPWVREGDLFVAYWTPPSLSDVLIATAIALLFGGAGMAALIRMIREWHAVRWLNALARHDLQGARVVLDLINYMALERLAAVTKDPSAFRVAAALVKIRRIYTDVMSQATHADNQTEVVQVGDLKIRMTPEERAAFEQSRARADEQRRLREQQNAERHGGQPPTTSEVIEGGDPPHGC